jgi:hypothetical protein
VGRSEVNNLEWARYYVNEKKWSVIPVRPGDKKPKLGKNEVLPYREKFATDEELQRWFSDPKVNVGIITGKLSNLFVVDLDKSKDHYQEENALLHFGDNINTPIAETPSGGNHLYFTYPGKGITIGENILPAIDYRGEGGYVVAPPSVNGYGNAYSWIQSLTDYTLADVPHSFINILTNNNSVHGSFKGRCDSNVTSVTECDIWMDGSRDGNLFTVSNTLTLAKHPEDYIRQVLRAIVASWGEHDEGWINAKVKSAMDRQERYERNMQAEIDAFIGVTTGDFSVTEMDKELNIVTKRDKATRRKALSRRKDITVEKVGNKDIWWRRIDTDIETIDFNEEQGTKSTVLLPLQLHDLVEICEGNIILIAGEYNAGKTTFALNTLQMNKNRMKIRYISSEMKAGEFRSRWRTFNLGENFWLPDEMTEYVKLKNNLTSLVLPDGLTIVDYLEFKDGDYTVAAEKLKQIHDKLETGVCIICNQQKEGAKLPRSGDLIMEKPRLAVTLRKVATVDDQVIGIAEILKAKQVLAGKMDGKKLKYELQDHGSRFKVWINWGYWK